MLKPSAARGFTLVELMVGITIVGIVLAMGMPSFATYIQATKLASSAQSYLSGIQLARTEAIRRNTPVQFILTDSPIAPNIENAAVLSTSGQNWVVRVFDPPPGAGVFNLIQAKSAQEGAFSSGGVSSVQITGAAAPGAFDGSISFDGFGRTGALYTLNLQNLAGGFCAPAGPMRCPRIRVSAGGQASVCDPIVVAPGDSRAC